MQTNITLATLVAAALTVAIAVSVPAHAQSADDGQSRGISVVPLTAPSAAEIADAINADVEEAVSVAVAADAAAIVEDAAIAEDAAEEATADETGLPAAKVTSAAELYDALIDHGLAVTVVGRDTYGRYAFAVRPGHADYALLIVVEGATGKVLKHHTISLAAGGYGYTPARYDTYGHGVAQAYAENCSPEAGWVRY